MVEEKKNQFMEKNYLVSGWFIYKIFIKYLSRILDGGVKNIKVISGFEIEVEVLPKNLYPLMYFFNKHSLCQCKSLMDIVCYDLVKEKKRFFLVYNLLSVRYNNRINVKVRLQRIGELMSMISIYKSAAWSEREVFDFFGIFFF